ncbi:MAG: putative rane protein [Solirubrobacteraceae bacterium]|jgi:cytochrome c oxidase assembly factor CtaG|nr:putative rane protein [Solirubrobacteraceae bacterium]
MPYIVRSRHLARIGRPVPGWHVACYLAGLLTLAGAELIPSDRRFAAHMVEHLLIGDVGALLLTLGLTGPVLAPVLRRTAFLRVLAHPGVALPAWALNLSLWHLPVLYEGAVAHPLLHGLEHACFLFFSVNLWMGLLGPLPKPAWFGNLARLGYIVVARLTGAVLGNVFLWSGHVFYADTYPRLSDQSLAGSVMMVEESVLTIGLFCWLFLRTARQTEERDALVEEFGVDPQRAARAVAAGRGDELRARLEAGRAAGGPAELVLELGGEREQPRL